MHFVDYSRIFVRQNILIMSKVKIDFRLPGALLDEAYAEADDQGIKLSEWLRDAVKSYLGYDNDDEPTLEEVQAMEWDELKDLIKDYRLKIKAKDYETSPGYEDDESLDDLRDAVTEELGLTDDDDDDDDDDDL